MQKSTKSSLPIFLNLAHVVSISQPALLKSRGLKVAIEDGEEHSDLGSAS